MSDKKKALLIVNPCAGKNKSRAGTFDIVDRLSREDYEFDAKTTTCQGDATEIVKKYIDGNDLVICCGGDGTLNETINGIMQLSRRVPVGYIPTGSTNDLASTIGLPTKSVKDATDVIIDGHTNGYDIGLFNNRFFSYIASFGALTSLSYNTSQKLKNIFGHNAYVLDGLMHVPTHLKSAKPMHARVECDGRVYEDDFYFGAVSNSVSVAGTFKYDPNEIRLDDGKFEVLLVRGIKRPTDLVTLLIKAVKGDFNDERILFFKTTGAKFKFDKPVKWTLDGEYGGEHKEVRISILNKAIDIYSPENELFCGEEKDEREYAYDD